MIAGVERAAKDANRLLGGIPTPERSVAELLGAGYDLVLADADVALLRGERTSDVARQFRISPGRISQLRREFERSWREFHGEGDAAAEN